MSADRMEALADRLDAISEDLAELAIDELRNALGSRSGRPEHEKRITQARRAVEKAAHLLRSPDRENDAD
jgi:hypothetical protein